MTGAQTETMTRRKLWHRTFGGGIAAHFDWLAISIVGGFADHPANVRSAAVTEEPRHDAVAVHCPVPPRSPVHE